MTSRRSFIQIIPVAGVALLASRGALAAGPAAELDPKDPLAGGMGYSPDATKTDQTKYTKYAAGQVCGNCQLYQGKAGDEAGPCPIFAGRSVRASGWCVAWVKKA